MRTKIMAFILTLLLATTASAFDGGISIIKKDNMYGIGAKAEILKLEYLEGTRNQTLMNKDLSISEVKKEFNIGIEPDFTLLEHKDFKVEFSPILGVSNKSTEELHQNKVGPACSIENGHIPEGHCFSYVNKSDVSLLSGASLKFDYEIDPQLHFYAKAGLISNGDKYKDQASVGVTLPF